MNMRAFLLSVGITCGLVCSATPAQASDAETSNKVLARRVFEEGYSRGLFTVPYTTDYVGHRSASTYTQKQGLAEIQGWRNAFPDLKLGVDFIIAEDDVVAVRWTAHGANTGEGNGIPATGRQVKVSGQTIFRFKDGQIAEEWTLADALQLYRQLGYTPPSLPASATATSQTLVR